ncbi:MAG: metallophosphoesterase family protein [Coriobacteriia bacterium]|nr:metallophosphoesterase family protein [Coriobacteriia bacterium]
MAASGGSTDGVVRVGLVSDTHGVLDPRVNTVFARECPLAAIVHAGDIGSDPDLYWELEAIAPVTAVLGNCDWDLPGLELAGVARVTVAGVRVLAIHDFTDLGPIPDDVDVVVRGHTHRPSVAEHGDVLVVNPGSASQRRSMPSRSVAILELAEGERPSARIVMLDDVAPSR